jgi:hypothetical protein
MNLQQLLDAAHAADVPGAPPVVAGYVDGLYRWSAADWARFPRSVQVRIATSALTDDGNAGDVETGDMTPQQAPSWVLRRRAAGVEPMIYCSLATWPQVKSEFGVQAVPQPAWWVADWSDPAPHLVAGSAATQYLHDQAPGYDVSQIDLDQWSVGVTIEQLQAFLDGLAVQVPGQTTFLGWMKAVLGTEQGNVNALAEVLADLKAGGDPATLAVVERIEAALKSA